MRANRLLGAALAEHNLVKYEDLTAASDRLLELAAAGDLRQTSLLDEHGLGAVDLRSYESPEELRKSLDLGACWATWSVPFDREEDFHFIATAYYLSSAVRAYWEKIYGKNIIWSVTTMDIIADFLDRQQAEREEAAKAAAKAAAEVAAKVAAKTAAAKPKV
jgi:hypothetical protein